MEIGEPPTEGENKATPILDRVTEMTDKKEYSKFERIAKERAFTPEEFNHFKNVALNLKKWKAW